MNCSIRIRKVTLFIVFVMIMLVLTACGEKVIRNESDEVKLYNWEYFGNEEVTSSLIFEDSTATLTVKSFNEECCIKGICTFNDSCFIIIDENSQKSYTFNYKLLGDKLRLEYEENTIEFEKRADYSALE